MKTKIGLVSLGCPKNLVDSEEMLGALVGTGQAEMVGDARQADVLVVNTCAFIESAKQESIDAILQAVRRKQKGQVQKVIVSGCLAQRYGAELGPRNSRSGRFCRHPKREPNRGRRFWNQPWAGAPALPMMGMGLPTKSPP